MLFSFLPDRVLAVYAAAALFFGFLICGTSAASSAEEANLQRLAKDPVWHALLHYEPSGSAGRQLSNIITAEYFLSEVGQTSPLQELRATVKAISDSVDEPDQHIKCRYPARYMWIAEQLKISSDTVPEDCPAYRQWIEPGSVQSASLVFATGHMKSPASFFGHNFLKFNGANSDRSGDLLDHTINFGADLPDNVGGLAYFYNGIFGGYSALFERQPFSRHMAKYGEEDLRDVWEYELEVSDAQLQFLVAHAWELQAAKFRYYFFRKNCAYQIAKLLGLVTPAELVPEYMPWTMPYNLFENLVKIRVGETSFVRDISYHPSRRSRFHQRYFALTVEQRDIFVALVNRVITLDDERFESQDIESKFSIIDSLLDYYEFRLRLDKDNEQAAEDKKDVLQKRFSMPASDAADSEVENKPFPPHLAQRPGFVSISATRNSQLGDRSELKIRPAYFDFLALDMGRSSAGNFTLLDTTVVLSDGDAYLRKFDFINITNLAPSVTGMQGDSGTSWHFRLGTDQPNNACGKCQKPMMDLQIGKATRLNQGLTGFFMGGARWQKSYLRDNALALQLSAGVTGSLGSNIRLVASAVRHEDTGSNGLDRNRIKLDFRFGSKRNWDIRAGYSRDVAEEFSISVGHYW